MYATRTTVAAIAAITIVLAGCGPSSGEPVVSDTDASAASTGTTGVARATPEASGDATRDDHGDHEEDIDHGDHEGDVEEPTTSRPPTDEEIAAIFNAHAGAHASHAPAGDAREFPEGIVPARIQIPAIGVDAAVGDLSLAGPEPEVPEDFDEVGWYTQTREPGEIGPAVLAGHIDSRSGPAVFIDLDELQPGDEIIVTDAAGDERRFLVDGLGQYPKDALPDEVFGFDAPSPQLRLITCGGSFDPSSGHYRDNVVVYTSLIEA